MTPEGASTPGREIRAVFPRPWAVGVSRRYPAGSALLASHYPRERRALMAADDVQNRTDEAPSRWREASSVDEHFQVVFATSSGEPKPQFENEAYLRLKAKGL